MYPMLETKLRRPHYDGMVKLLPLGSTKSVLDYVAADAFELYGEVSNWMVEEEDLVLVSTAMAILHSIIRSLSGDPTCTINQAVFDALALSV
jgi:hypothetical protein